MKFSNEQSAYFSFLSLCRDAFTAAAVNGIRSRQEQTDHHCTSHVQ